MIRIAILLLLLSAWAVPASSSIYSCRQPDGTIYLTDDPERFPPDCEPVGELILPDPPEPDDPTTPPPHIPPDEPLPEDAWPQEEPADEEPWTAPEAVEEPFDEPPAEPPAPGSAGFPPGLQPQQPPTEEPDEFPLEEPPDPGAPRLDPWMEEAQALAREYSEAMQPAQTVEEEALTQERLQQIEARIDAFIEQLALSGLSPGEQDAVMQELPVE